jgi:phosphoribosylamine--glycine ligase
MKDVLDGAGVPTARHRAFAAGEVDAAHEYLRGLASPYVVKTDGLAAGKGVLVTTSIDEAVDDVRSKLSGQAFGDAGRRVVIEEGLRGPEVSLLCLADGRAVVPLASAQDYKRVGDGDLGPNTGGMGAYSPVDAVGPERADELAADLVQPTLDELRRRGVDYRGVLYAGLMLTGDGPKVLEFNVRFGDPEAQVVLPRLDSDLAALLHDVAAGELRSPPRFRDDAAVTVVCASEGYPHAPRSGDVIHGLEAASAVEGVSIFCAGVALGSGGELVTAGGRVLNVTAVGSTRGAARERAYRAVGCLSWPGMVVRGDIARADREVPSPPR